MGLTNGSGALSSAEKAVNEMKTTVAVVRTSERKQLTSLLAFMYGNVFWIITNCDYFPFQRYVSALPSFTSRVTEP